MTTPPDTDHDLDDQLTQALATIARLHDAAVTDLRGEREQTATRSPSESHVTRPTSENPS